MRVVYFIAGALAILILTALVIAPAQWAASYVQSASKGRVELAEASRNNMEWLGNRRHRLARGKRRFSCELARASVVAAQSVGAVRGSSRPGTDTPFGAFAAVDRQRTVIRAHGHTWADDDAAAGIAFGRARRPLEHDSARWNSDGFMGSARGRTGPLARAIERRMAIRIERPDARVADGSLPLANERRLAGNSAGITNHFGSPRAEGQWHNQRGWALTLHRTSTSSGWHRPGCQVATDGADLAAGAARRRGISVELRWLR